MDLKSVITEVRTWPPEDRLRLMEEIWDGLTDDGHEPEISDDLKELLDRRLEALDKHPDAVVPWEVVEDRALQWFRK